MIVPFGRYGATPGKFRRPSGLTAHVLRLTLLGNEHLPGSIAVQNSRRSSILDKNAPKISPSVSPIPIPLGMRCHRLVAQQDIPIAEAPRLGQLQSQLRFDAVEHRPPLAKSDWVD